MKNDPKCLIFLRHGTTTWNKSGRLNSFTDLRLTKDGKIEILDLIENKLRDLNIEKIISSPLLRARQTAKLIGTGLSLPVEINNLVEELNFGVFEGKSPKELMSSDLSKAFSDWRKEKNPVVPKGVETFEEAISRAYSFIQNYTRPTKNTLIVSHGVFLRILIAGCVLDMNPSQYRRLKIDNGAVSIVRWEGDIPRLEKFNF